MQPTADPRVDDVLARLERVERQLALTWPTAENSDWPWKHLVRNPRSWHRQLYIKDRNLTVRQLIGTVRANGLSPETAAADLDLPVDAVREALDYAEQHPELLNYEAAYERLILEQEGHGRGPGSVPG
jgi:uncharacterized protein (DUF433 family)